MRNLLSFSLTVAALTAVACGATTDQNLLTNGPGTGASGASGSVDGDPTSVANAAFPCEVATLIASRCLGCHGTTLQGGAPMPLVTAADFSAIASYDDKSTVAERSLVRMQETKSPMPPKPESPVSAADLAAFQAWIASGLPSGRCDANDGGPIAPSPYDTPEICTSNTQWTGGNHESAFMRPGFACISCHEEKHGPFFTFAGTAYPSAHEPDDCNGASSSSAGTGAVVEITDAVGEIRTMKVNKVGNFYGNLKGLTMPYTARVLVGEKERAMTTPADSGDCNGCHTLEGKDGAPGRIVLP